MDSIIDSLSPLERKIVPFLNETIADIENKSGLDGTSVLRGLKFLENKKLLVIKNVQTKWVELGVNGIYYKKNNLPERTLLITLEKEKSLSLEESPKKAGLSENEFKAALGVLKKKMLITIINGKISMVGKDEKHKKFPEEQLLDKLPLELNALSPEERYAFENLKGRKEVIQIIEKQALSFELTEQGKKIAGKKIESDLLEEVTPELIKLGTKNKKFRRYDVLAPVPKMHGGKRHFVNQAVDYAKRIWLEMGFKEMSGTLTDSSFWIFDALFTAQDHPVREMQDTFFIKGKSGDLPEKKLVDNVKKAHEKGVEGSRGWGYKWEEEEARRVALRTHTTSLSARTLSQLKKDTIPAKYFAIGKAFRNETIDWSHGIEFYQTEGIVIDENATFTQLIGYLRQFYKKMGFDKIRIRPSFFPYTEPSLEVDVFHPERKVWLELGGAGILRPEVTVPLLGKAIPVLAWGQGFDRTIMDYYSIKDLREMYSNDIKNLREKKVWLK